MNNDNRIGRLGLLMVGLGIGAAITTIPGVASADTFDPNDFAISIDGITLFQVGTATASSAFGGFAIADGNDSSATATGGIGDVASAFGAGSHALVDSGSFDVAAASGLDSTATADFGSGDTALAETDFSEAEAGGGAISLGNDDFASAFGAVNSAYAEDGSFNFASIFDPAGTMGGDAAADAGNGNVAYVVGDGDLDRAGGVASTLLGNYDIAEIFGNGGMADAGSSADAPGSFDLAEIFGNELDALAATGGNFLVDLAPPL
jgi:hypothetical protein